MSYQTLTQDQDFLLQTGMPVVSLYVPTHRVSHPDHLHADQVRWRNQLREARTYITVRFPGGQDLLDRLDALEAQWAADTDFWRYQSDTLAVFVSAEACHWYSLPLSLPALTYVDEHAYLLPLLNILHQQHRFFILALSQQEVAFFEADRFHLYRIAIADLVPDSLADHRGPRHSAPGLQYHVPSPGGEPIFHGRGGPRERHDQELTDYLKAVDRGLMEMLHDEEAPLVVAAVDELAGRYKGLTRYDHVMDAHLGGNFESAQLMTLYERAYALVQPVFRAAPEAAAARLRAQPDRTATSLDDLFALARQGRLDTLLVREGYQAWGYRDEGGNPLPHGARRPGSTCLVNSLALQALAYGGTVWRVPAEMMPQPRVAHIGLRRGQ